MSVFWDFLKFGVPTAGAIGLGVWAYKRHWSPLPIGAAAVVGWGGGYLVYAAASRAADHVEGLPSTTVVPEVGQFSTPTLQEAVQGVEDRSRISAFPEDPRNKSPYWDVAPGAEYATDSRGANGQPKENSVTIDMTAAPAAAPAAAPMAAAPMAPMQVAGPALYDPGGSFGSGGSIGGI